MQDNTKITSILEPLILYVVIFKRNTFNKEKKVCSKSSNVLI